MSDLRNSATAIAMGKAVKHSGQFAKLRKSANPLLSGVSRAIVAIPARYGLSMQAGAFLSGTRSAERNIWNIHARGARHGH